MILNGGKKRKVKHTTLHTILGIEPANENHHLMKKILVSEPVIENHHTMKKEEMKKPVTPILPQNVEDLLKDMLDTYPYPYSSISRVYVRRRDAKMRSLGK